jgi:hypothetical protein
MLKTHLDRLQRNGLTMGINYFKFFLLFSKII